MRHSSRGFTLIELLVVIAIIGVLSSVILVSLNAARQKGYDAQRVANLRSIQTALELYATDHNGQYPPSGSAGGCWSPSWDGQVACGGSMAPNAVIPGLVPTYLPSFPTDPEINKSGNTCDYLYNSNGTDYKLLFHACPTSNVCYGSGEATGGFYDPTRPTWACAVWSSSASQSW